MDIFKSVCMLLAGVAVFLLGMKLMGDGLEKGAGKAVKKIFSRIGNNRFAGVGIGAGTTAIIQSSSATTVMVVGFVNAGVMTLVQAASIIMGANIGTTITAFLGVFSTFSMSSVFMAIGIVGIFMYMFAKKDKVKCAGEIITGIAIIFVGMNFMSQAFNSDAVKQPFTNAFAALADNPAGPLLFLLIGALFTGIVQSSSATTVMVVGMVGGAGVPGIMPVGAALFIVLGANIGTCVTAALASIGASTNARRAALIHLMFNLIGVLLFIPILWPLQTQIGNMLGAMAPGNPSLQVAFFHLFFNVATTALLIGFRKQLVFLATKAIKLKKGEDVELLKLDYIDDKVLQSPSEIGDAVLKETLGMAELAMQNLGDSLKATYTLDLSNRSKIINVEQKINFINREIGRYLVKLKKETEMTDEQMNRLRDIHSAVSEIERIGDHAADFIDEAGEMKEQSAKFTEEAVLELADMFDKVHNMYLKAMSVFESRDLKRLDEIADLERDIDETKHDLGFRHIERLNDGLCTVEAGAHFYAIITALERVADHLTNIAFSIKTLSGVQLEDLKQKSKDMAKKRQEKKPIYW